MPKKPMKKPAKKGTNPFAKKVAGKKVPAKKKPKRPTRKGY